MIESDPVAGLMRQGTTQIHRSIGTSGESRVANDNTIVLGVVVIVGRESGVSEEIICGLVIEGNGVDVESVGTTISKLFLHCYLFGGPWTNVVEPSRVVGSGGVDKFERESSSGVVLVQDLDLVRDLLIPEARCV